MIEMVIIAAIMSSITMRVAGNVAVDGFFAARGMESPRYAQAKARRTPGAASRYWHEVWDDVWTTASKKRAAKQANPDRPRSPFRVFWSNAWRDGWVSAERWRQGKATRPRPETVTVPGSVVPDFEDEQQDGPQDGDGDGMTIRDKFAPFVSTQPRDGDGPETDLTFGDDPTDPTGVSSCPECKGTAITEDGVCLSCRDRQEQRNQHHEQQAADGINHWRDAWRNVDRNLHPTPAVPHQEGTTMTATTIEVVGLESGITFSETSAQAYTAMVGNIEQTLAALSGFDVGGPAAAAASAAMEQSAAAAQSMLTLAEELKKHRGVAEAIDATPGAGKREFYTAGR